MIHQEATRALEQLLRTPIQNITKIGAGGNSRVYRVTAATGTYAAKFYYQRTADGRDRLEAEFNGLQFLWNNGIRCIPQPLAADRETQVALYQYISGTELSAAEIRESEIDQLSEFLIGLKRLRASVEASGLADAAEASFTVAGIVANIRKRLNLLTQAQGDYTAYRDLKSFLESQLIPALEYWDVQAKSAIGGEAAYGETLAYEARTLSPSDFGFHNALALTDGKLVFVDFEYFGWDDPAKMISDFIWHPRSTMPSTLKQRFASRLTASFSDMKGFENRLKAVFPLFGLKWCTILLNEFHPENLARRRFASGSIRETEDVLLAQLEKARNTLHRVNLDEKVLGFQS